MSTTILFVDSPPPENVHRVSLRSNRAAMLMLQSKYHFQAMDDL